VIKRTLRLLLVVLATAVAASAATVASASSAPTYSARLSGCFRSLDPSRRAVDVDAAMYARVPGTRGMAIRVELFERRAGETRFRRLPRDGRGKLSTWHAYPRPVANPETLFEYSLDVSLERRTVPAVYRFRVGFRWYGRHGRLLRQRFQTTGNCLQPDMRPDLRVRSITVVPPRTAGGSTRYEAVIRNAGLSRTSSFNALLQSGGMTVPGQTRTLAGGLGPGATVTVSFSGPACAADAAPVVVLDPDNRVDERDEKNNSRAAICP